jgi:hypothetical protein
MNWNRIIKMVRSNKHVGNGSCSCIDECLEDSEIIELLQDGKINNETDVLPFLYQFHNDWLSSLNYADYTSPFEKLRIALD